MNARVRQVLATTAVVLTVILLAGATYQGVSTALERRKYPRPGGLIDVGGHQLHLYCTGDGTPVVVLEASAGVFSAAWGWVQPEVAKATRVCSYDRAGLGWSEAGDRTFDPNRVPDELHALLGAAAVPPPYVLVGHALGASFSRAYAARYPDEVSGIVLIDPAHALNDESPLPPLSPWLARAGVLRATGMLSHEAEGLPDPARGAVSAFLNRPDHLTRAALEVRRWNDAIRLGEVGKRDTIAVAAIDTAEWNDGNAPGRMAEMPLLNDRARAKHAAAEIVDFVEKFRGRGRPEGRSLPR